MKLATICAGLFVTIAFCSGAANEPPGFHFGASADEDDFITRMFYFPVRGLFEPVRLAAAYTLLHYDSHITTKDADGKWRVDPPVAHVHNLRARLPYGQVPLMLWYLEGGELSLAQSGAILRHLGREHLLYGRTLAEEAYVDELLDAVDDVRSHINPIYYPAGNNQSVRDAASEVALRKFRDVIWPKSVDTIAARLEEVDEFTHHHHTYASTKSRDHIAENLHEHIDDAEADDSATSIFGLAVGRHVTIADFALYALIEVLASVEPRTFTRAPRFACTIAAVRSSSGHVYGYLTQSDRVRQSYTPKTLIGGDTSDGVGGGVGEGVGSGGEGSVEALMIADPWSLGREGFPAAPRRLRGDLHEPAQKACDRYTRARYGAVKEQ